MENTAATGKPRIIMVKLQAMLPDWVMSATPRSTGSRPVSSGQRAARDRVLTKP